MADYDQNFPPLPGAQKPYQLDGPNYDEAIMTPTIHPAGTPLAVELLEQLNTRAVATKDLPVEDGEPVSFFEHAVPAQ